ncbi:hypothetical protein [Streptomyces sp. NPDC096153]|uniref:hypothetical protein n=1 Tax=Streptomyces sp. NPDC096153 TaxID=3155548 RepID=UPI0033184B78
MGWSSANEIFNPVARALQTAGADDDTKRKVLGDLIAGLQQGDWDTEDESLEDFLDDPAIVAAFADHGVHTNDGRCCRQNLSAEAQRRITEALAEQFADGHHERGMRVNFQAPDGYPASRNVQPDEAAQVAIDAIRDLLTSTATAQQPTGTTDPR